MTMQPLDGMPEPPPAWERPEQGVRMGAQELDHVLAAALPHVGTDERVPALCGVRLSVLDGVLTSVATDTYSMLRERREVHQTCPPWAILVRQGDVRSLRVLLAGVLRGLKDAERAAEPVDLALEQTDEGPTLRVLGQDLDVRFTEAPGADGFPRSTDAMLDRLLDEAEHSPLVELDVHLSPRILARTTSLQRAGRTGHWFRWRAALKADQQGEVRPSPVVVTTGEGPLVDDVVLAVMPVGLPT